jgi:hypothetical protein
MTHITPRFFTAVRLRVICLEHGPPWLPQKKVCAGASPGTTEYTHGTPVDYNELLRVLPATSPLVPQIRQALQRVKPRREAAQKAEMGEMVDKLKGLGNSVLGQSVQPCCGLDTYPPTGNFGLSTDNFKFEPNGQGGYSMNFVR